MAWATACASRRRNSEPLKPTARAPLSLRLWPRSLTFRVIAFSTVWAILTLVVIFTLITTLYRQASERGFDSLLSAHLFNLIGSIGISDTGALTGAPDLGDLRFSEPNSGWYWSVEPASEGVHGDLHSSSMTSKIPSPSVAEVPFNASFQRSYSAEGIDGEQLEVFESEFVLDAKNRAARFRVMGNQSELEQEIATFQRRLLTYLSLFGVGMVETGHFALVLAFALSLVQTIVPLFGARLDNQRLMAVGGPVAITGFALTALSFAALASAYASSDFSVASVWENSHSLQPMIYKITGTWGNHEGSMLLWVLILTFFGALVAVFGNNLPATLKANVLAVQGMSPAMARPASR